MSAWSFDVVGDRPGGRVGPQAAGEPERERDVDQADGGVEGAGGATSSRPRRAGRATAWRHPPRCGPVAGRGRTGVGRRRGAVGAIVASAVVGASRWRAVLLTARYGIARVAPPYIEPG